MGWKRIMNKKKRQKGRTGKKTAPEAAHVLTESEIKQYLTGLLPEWNLRLLMETDASAKEVLWVESVTVTAYQSAPETGASGKLNFWKRFLGRWDFSRFLKK